MRNGFSLIEVLVVLVIVGLLAGLASPPLIRTYERYQVRMAWDSLETQISQTRLRAHLAMRDLRLVPPGAAPDVDAVVIEVPDSWTVRMETPEDGIVFRQTGVCEGGRMLVDVGSGAREVTLEPPRCTIMRPPAG